MKLLKRIKARQAKVPFMMKKKWYNSMAMNKYSISNMIDIFDENNDYIIPELGNEITFIFRNLDGEKRCKYRITKIHSGNKNNDWLYDYDWIDVDLEFICFIDEVSFDKMVENLILKMKHNCPKKPCEECYYNKYNEDGNCYKIKELLSNIKKYKERDKEEDK